MEGYCDGVCDYVDLFVCGGVMLEGVDGFLGVIVVLDVDLDFGSVSYCLEGGCFVFGVVDLDG